MTNPEPVRGKAVTTDVPPVIGVAQSKAFLPLGKWWMGGAVLATILGLLFIREFNPSQYFGYYPRCVLFSTTGIYCPGCGCLRATYHLLHGRILEALRCNPLYIMSLPCLGYYLVKNGSDYLRHGHWPEPHISRKALIVLGVTVLVFTVLRNIHAAPFWYLAPEG